MNYETKTNESYRRILATAHKLETIQSNLDSVIDLFLVPIVKLYSKLSNDCLKLLFGCNFKLDYFRKAEELLWRKIYYDIYRFQKTKRQRNKRQDEFLIETHFVSGIGFYSTLIVKLRSHYKIQDVQGLMSPFDLSLGPIDNFEDTKKFNVNSEDCHSFTSTNDNSRDSDADDNSNSNINTNTNTNTDPARDWARLAIYRSLVYMGDLARYLHESGPFEYRRLAFDFYLSASRNQPDYGLPFNQLATLSGGQNYNLDAICNYMRCCLRSKPFERAEGNMKNLFELNRKVYQELEKDKTITSVSEVFSSKEPSVAAESIIRTIVVKFIKLVSDLWIIMSDKSTNVKSIEMMGEETRAFFEILRETLELEPIIPLANRSSYEFEFEPISDGSASHEKPRYVTPSIMYEFCSISIMLIAKLQRNIDNAKLGDTKNMSITDILHTLALNLLYYSTSKCQKMIIMKLQELRVHRSIKSCIDTTGSSVKSYCGKKSNENSTNRRSLSRIRQKEAASTYTDKSRSTIINNDDSDMSELEETALSTIDALEISSDMSEEAGQGSDLIDLGSSSDEISSVVTPERATNDLSNSTSRPLLRPTRSQNYDFQPRFNDHFGSTSSLPVPDLNIINDKLGRRVLASCRSPLTGSNLDLDERSSPESSSDETGSYLALRDIDRVHHFIYKHTYLTTVKIFCDWLLSNGRVITSNLASFRSFNHELENLVTVLDDLRKVAENRVDDATPNIIDVDIPYSSCNNDDDESLLYQHSFKGPSWKQKYPLSCDYPLFNLEPIKSAHRMNIEFDTRKKLTDVESGFLTIECVKAFCHALTIFLDNKYFE